jgi:hypothetical protein
MNPVIGRKWRPLITQNAEKRPKSLKNQQFSPFSGCFFVFLGKWRPLITKMATADHLDRAPWCISPTVGTLFGQIGLCRRRMHHSETCIARK